MRLWRKFTGFRNGGLRMIIDEENINVIVWIIVTITSAIWAIAIREMFRKPKKKG